MPQSILPAPTLESIAGTVERITFHSEESGFCVLKIALDKTEDEKTKTKGKNSKAKKDSTLTTVIGHLPTIRAGESIEATGTWIHNPQYGQQFKATSIKTVIPSLTEATLEGIEKYLGSGMIKGVGPVVAKKLAKAFGSDVLRIIEEEPNRLRTVPGLGESRIKMIIQGWAEQKSIRDIMIFLVGYGISTGRAVRIYKTYGDDAIKIITNNPYQLARDIRGIGFTSADAIAEKVGISKTSMIRARAGISHALTTAMEHDGHCGLPKGDLIVLCQKLLEIPLDLIAEALDLEIKQKSVVLEESGDTSYVFLKRLALAEITIANRIHELQQGPLPWPVINSDLAIGWVEKNLAIELSNSQKQAITTALSSKVMIITGGPGVGKTTLVNAIIKILNAKKLDIMLAAPTGRAAKRLTESTGVEAKTIHRMLQMNPVTGQFLKDDDSPLNCDLLIVDEMSMVDVPLMQALMRGLPSSSALFLIGDVDQLPSVGPGQVLADLIDSGVIPVIKLTEIFRQAATSTIITTAHAINQGYMPDLTYSPDEKSDFYFIETETPEDALGAILKLVTTRIPQKFGLSPLSDIQVLSPMTRGIIGTHTLNKELQQALNPNPGQSIERFGTTFGVGDKVMQIVNNYDKEVYNGDIGFIRQINRDTSEVGIAFDTRDVSYSAQELEEIVLAYATTIHKSQGSEYPAVIIPLMTQHYIMLQKKLVYTAITRGKKLVVVVGQRKALSMAIQKREHVKRWGLLRERVSKAP
ncbi:MAG: ATP-dependent RecD-like DNA helicase [Alphaproteobacteria bacterium]|nr:ATP-dependent RecD-like DNA helicase [Alphaproteobacteria bacterium]